MTYKAIYDPERFYLLDHNWEFLSVRDGEMTARVENVNILSGEYQGQILESVMITFRGFRMEWLRVIEKDELIPIPREDAEKLLLDDTYFVFSYCADGQECELAAVGESAVAMRFAFDSAQVAWNAPVS